MPTYNWKCPHCDVEYETFQTISEYCADPTVPNCIEHGHMERKLCVVPGLASSNPLAGDRHYEGMRSQEGTNIGSRTAHRRYMKEKGVTMDSDFKDTWKKAAEDRQKFRQGAPDPTLKRDVAEVVTRAINN